MYRVVVFNTGKHQLLDVFSLFSKELGKCSKRFTNYSKLRGKKKEGSRNLMQILVTQEFLIKRRSWTEANSDGLRQTQKWATERLEMITQNTERRTTKHLIRHCFQSHQFITRIQYIYRLENAKTQLDVGCSETEHTSCYILSTL